MDDTVELLDRQFDFLLKQPDDASFLIQLEPFLRALGDDDRLVSYLDDLREELVSVIQVLDVLLTHLLDAADRGSAVGGGVRAPAVVEAHER